LIRQAARVCVEKGRRILARLQADPRLSTATETLGRAQASLEERLNAFDTAVQTERKAVAVCDEVYRKREDTLRAFALQVLSANHNRHGSEWYLRYFPAGYGTMVHRSPGENIGLAEVLLGKLGQEEDPNLVLFRDRLAADRAASIEACSAWETAVQDRVNAFQYLNAEKLLWVFGLAASRHQAHTAYPDDFGLVRSIYKPALPKTRGSSQD